MFRYVKFFKSVSQTIYHLNYRGVDYLKISTNDCPLISGDIHVKRIIATRRIVVVWRKTFC
ncbi:MAG: hypothetical protein ACTS6H_01800 [Candidatus Hodgkinia cicadicola]